MEDFKWTNDISKLLVLSQNVIDRVGDCANIEQKVNLNSIHWETLAAYRGWTLQRNRLSNKARIIDDKGIQKGNGSLMAMKEKMARLLSKEFLRPGDVIGVSRGAYEHYAIYIGNGRIIHYAGENSDFKGKVSIHEAPFEEFLKSNKDYFVVSFEGEYPVRLQSSTNFISNGFFEYSNNRVKKVYSAEETVQRAYSRIGETKYSLLNNNCEHFAMWCKTRKSESMQVKLMARYAIAAGIGLSSFAESKA